MRFVALAFKQMVSRLRQTRSKTLESCCREGGGENTREARFSIGKGTEPESPPMIQYYKFTRDSTEALFTGGPVLHVQWRHFCIISFECF